ncbi:transposase [Marinobacter sp. F3R11]|uniref:transposase n=1 Tax=Marinobacter sp. F3R11 TaxID=2267231 RepID=UPI003965C631
MSRRRKYSSEFKREAITLTRQPGVSCRQVALEIGIIPNLLSQSVPDTSYVPMPEGVGHQVSETIWSGTSPLWSRTPNG